MKIRQIKGSILVLTAVAAIAMTLGCLVRPIGPGDGGRGHGDRYDYRDGGRRDHDRGRDHRPGDRDRDGDRR